MADFTTAPPPVTTSSRMSLWFMTAAEVSSVGLARLQSRVPGPPALTMARLRRDTAWLVTPLAEGCGLKTTALPAATMLMLLLMMVAAGFVHGVMEPTTPNGAGSTRVSPSSPV